MLIPFFISIHASAKEATTPPYAQTIKVEDFNPRLREGGDKSALWNLEILPDFNPRLREGGDAADNDKEKRSMISIHASAREATAAPNNFDMLMTISIHASAREATSC